MRPGKSLPYAGRWIGMLRVVLASAIVCSFALPLIAAAGGRTNVSGRYESNWDDVQLVQDGDRVRGTYVCCGGGTIEGRIIEGRTLRYRWKQPDGWGMGVWKIDGDRLSGTWGFQQDDDDGGRWDLSRTSLQVATP
jgi:hypothetical protein